MHIGSVSAIKQHAERGLICMNEPAIPYGQTEWGNIPLDVVKPSPHMPQKPLWNNRFIPDWEAYKPLFDPIQPDGDHFSPQRTVQEYLEPKNSAGKKRKGSHPLWNAAKKFLIGGGLFALGQKVLLPIASAIPGPGALLVKGAKAVKVAGLLVSAWGGFNLMQAFFGDTNAPRR